MASEVVEKKIIQLGLDKTELTTGLQKAMSEVDGFTSKLKGIKTTAFENIKTSVTNMSSSFSKLTSTLSISVSDKNNKFAFLTFNLSALIFTCSADSSPETYNTFPSPSILSHNWSINVDFPIPSGP